MSKRDELEKEAKVEKSLFAGTLVLVGKILFSVIKGEMEKKDLIMEIGEKREQISSVEREIDKEKRKIIKNTKRISDLEKKKNQLVKEKKDSEDKYYKKK